MKKMRNIMITGFFVVILALIGTLPQTAPFTPATDEAFADTTYTVFIYSGKEGYFGESGNTVKKITGLTYGQNVTVNLGDYDLTLKHPKDYYVRGLKIAGHDNDLLSSYRFQSYSFKVTEDVSFSVAYGKAGGMVPYKVYYRDKNGQDLRDPQEFYGMVGDRPVVAYLIIDGYLPNDQNLTKTLREDISKNVFVFTYHKVDEGGGENPNPDDENGGGNNNGNGGNGNGGNGNGTMTGDNGNMIPGTNIRDIDDEAPPLAALDDEETPKSSPALAGNALIFGIVGVGLLIAAILLYFLLRRKDDEEE